MRRVVAVVLPVLLSSLLSSCFSEMLYESRMEKYGYGEAAEADKNGTLGVYEDETAYYVDFSKGSPGAVCLVFKKKNGEPATEHEMSFLLGWELARKDAGRSVRFHVDSRASRPECAELVASDGVKVAALAVLVQRKDDGVAILYVAPDSASPWLERDRRFSQISKSLYVFAVCGDIVLFPLELAALPFIHM